MRSKYTDQCQTANNIVIMIAIGKRQPKISLFNALVPREHAKHGICISFSSSYYLNCLKLVTV